ncbi:MAG: M1 family aminopeptidase [Acidimicrobiales bacterium]
MSIDPFRLPKSVRPTDYRITIRPDLDAESFSGSVSIDAVIEDQVATIVLNSDELTINSATIIAGPDGGGSPVDCEHALDVEHERLELIPPQPLDPGPATIEISFEGVFNEKLIGLYLSRFTDDDGRKHKLATTQFEAAAARKCFPCWDEPEFKATFTLRLLVDRGLTAVANSPEVARTTEDNGLVRFDFAPTMIMSTYLVAFVVGPLEITEPVDVDGVPLRIVHVPGKSHLTDFALEAGTFALRYLTDYFGLPYPDQKLDLVAIPDFAFGAMENLGCVTFREVLLLIDPDKATQPELQRAADVINHEVAHMWFGDLVTMKWWNGLWLNEAFATFMEMRCTDAFRPAWQRWTNFGLSRTAAFDTDSLASTRPIEYEVISPADADGMFDILTYEKGAAVVRMLEQYLGEDEFRAGIRRYMAEHQFGNAETTDLWDALEEETGEPVRRIMDSWIFQGGFPLISLSTEANGAAISLTQSRMEYAGGDRSADQTWSIPIRYRWRSPGAEQPRSDRLLLESAEPVRLELDEAPEWLVANAEGASFVRTAYPPELLEDLAEIGGEELSPVERYGLVDDAWASVLAGRTSAPAFLNLLEAMTGESNRSVWQRIIAGFTHLKRLVDGEAEERLEEIAHDAFAPALAHLGLTPAPEDDDQTRQLRGDLVRALGTVANDPEILEEAKRGLAIGRREPELIDAALMAASVDVVAANGDETDFDDFVAAWKSAETPQEEVRYLYALVDFPDPDLVARVYQLILDGEIRSQNAPLMLGRALANRHAGRQTWAFIVENWDRLTERFAAGLMVRMLEGLTRLNTEADQKSAADFFSDHDVAIGSQTLVQILEKQRVQVALREREAESLSRLLAL